MHYFRDAVRAFDCRGGPLSLDAILKGYVNDSSMATGSLYCTIQSNNSSVASRSCNQNNELDLMQLLNQRHRPERRGSLKACGARKQNASWKHPAYAWQWQTSRCEGQAPFIRTNGLLVFLSVYEHSCSLLDISLTVPHKTRLLLMSVQVDVALPIFISKMTHVRII